MKKEYDTDNLTPENSQEKILDFIEKAEVGSVKFIAFCDALEWRKAFNNLHEQRRLVEIAKTGGEIPEIFGGPGKNLNDLESDLRIAEAKFALFDVTNRRYASIIPGYVNALVYSEELIAQYEQHIENTTHFGLGDPKLEEMRRIGEAHDYISEYPVFEIKSAEQSAEGNWLIGLLKNFTHSE
jgi:hypothetical protein